MARMLQRIRHHEPAGKREAQQRSGEAVNSVSASPFNGHKMWKGLLAGAVGGLAASFVMNQFQSLWTKASEELTKQPQPEPEGDDATVKTAQAISRKMFCHDLSDSEKKWAGPAVHYAFGTLVGAVYGALAETVPAASAGCGTVYGAAVWLASDEIAIPALGLSAPPSETPVTGHVKALASHLVYGLATDVGRRALLKL